MNKKKTEVRQNERIIGTINFKHKNIKMTKSITYLTCIILAGFILNGCATMMGAKAAPEMRTFEKVIEISDKSKDQIYIKANGWFVETFNSAESVIEFQDKEAGKIMGKYVLLRRCLYI